MKELSKILLIMDAANVPLELTHFFEKNSINDYCRDYTQSIEKIDRDEVHVCLLDYSVFSTNSFDFIRKVLHRKPETHIILLTDQKEADVGLKALKLGATDYLVKNRLTTESIQKALQHAQQLYQLQKKLRIEIEERKKAEAVLEIERRQNELKTKFISIASHEFRVPLTTILSSASLIERYMKPDDERADKHLKKIKSSVTHLVGIMNDFLSLSRLEEGAIQTDLQPFELNSFIQDVLENISNLTKEKQEIIYMIDKNPFEVNSDKHILRNILNNLLSNAIKYSSANSFIYLTVECLNNTCVISVKDEGIGIPKQDQQEIFHRFFRSKNATNTQGTGLGLSIVKRYVDLLNGTIEFTSELNVGTTFKVSIPSAPAQITEIKGIESLGIES
jgi:signal transduction histidine kinase